MRHEKLYSASFCAYQAGKQASYQCHIKRTKRQTKGKCCATVRYKELLPINDAHFSVAL